MMVFRFIVSTLFMIIGFCSYGQDKINFEPKSLLKELEKLDRNTSDYEEIIMPDAFIAHSNSEGKFYRYKSKQVATTVDYFYLGRVNACRSGGCGIGDRESDLLNFEYFDYFIIFESDIRIRVAKVFNYQATHGQEITSNSWLKQFRGFKGNQILQVGKQIDGISGATISVYSITNDIQDRTEELRSWRSQNYE